MQSFLFGVFVLAIFLLTLWITYEFSKAIWGKNAAIVVMMTQFAGFLFSLLIGK